jgi:hypothetical protein
MQSESIQRTTYYSSQNAPHGTIDGIGAGSGGS